VDAFDISDLIARQRTPEHTYEEFFRAETLSLGLAIWPAGSIDDQEPHTEDEVYYVVSGRGWIRVGDEDRVVGPGAIVFVAAGVEHRFHDITEDLDVVVFWAPPHSQR
jgi:mannose-6-phosphate isomerase-like protein (cupin superfamily)